MQNQLKHVVVIGMRVRVPGCVNTVCASYSGDGTVSAHLAGKGSEDGGEDEFVVAEHFEWRGESVQR